MTSARVPDMKTLIFLCVLFIASCTATEAEAVVSLEDSTFWETIADASVFVKFYAPWCGACKGMAAAWETFAIDAVEQKNDIVVAQVDCTKWDRVCGAFGVTGYPTLVYFYNNIGYRYTGERKAAAFKAFALDGYKEAGVETLQVRKPVDPKDIVLQGGAKGGVPVEVTTAQQFDELIEKPGKTTFMMFYAPWCGHCKSLKPKYVKFAQDHGGDNGVLQVAKIDCDADSGKAVCARFGVRGFPTLKLFKSGVVYDYSGKRAVDDMAAFALGGLYEHAAVQNPFVNQRAWDEEKARQVADLTKDTELDMIQDDDENVKWLLLFYAPWCKYSSKVMPIWEKLAAERGTPEMRIAKVDCSKPKSGQNELCGRFGVTSFPTVYLVTGKKAYKYTGKKAGRKHWLHFAQEGYTEGKRGLDVY